MTGALMQAELAEAPRVFARAVRQPVPVLAMPLAFYTVARGSSDAAANVLSYEVMRETRRPMTSLAPSVFSIGAGVEMHGTTVLVISQSGASADLVAAARSASREGAQVIAIVNVASSPVAQAASLVLPIGAGPELAVPATKSVLGAIGAGMALLGALVPTYGERAAASALRVGALDRQVLPTHRALVEALIEARHVYVIGRDTGYGAAQELALKLKETCTLHAEAHSASEVLHGPLQLATNPLVVLILDTEQTEVQPSLDLAEARLSAAGARVWRIRASACGAHGLTPAAAAAALLCLTYPVVLDTARALGHDPDRPATLSKVTQTT
jgi:glutamine---fructose-6-phosphate transaminase (isomerizing)